MKWTEKAEERLWEYGCSLAESLNDDEFDDLLSDIRCHIEEELVNKGLEIATEQAVEQVIGGMGGHLLDEEAEELRISSLNVPYQPTPKEPLLDPVADPYRKKWGGLAKVSFVFCGIVLPSLALLLELGFRAASSVIFNPLPSLFHVGALVILIASAVFFFMDSAKLEKDYPAWLKWGVGFSTVVSLYYSILFAPLIPAGVVGIVFLGLGLLVLSPLLSLLVNIRMILVTGLRHQVWKGAALATLMFMLVDGRSVVVQYQINRYAVGDRAEKQSAIKWLQLLSNEDELLGECYRGGGVRNLTGGNVRWVSSWFGLSKCSSEKARMLFYEVTGKPFNVVKPGEAITGRRGSGVSDWSFDDGHGGDEVAGRIRGLSMQQSRMDVHIDQASRIGYAEWIIEFQNISSQSREARMKFVLPDEGLVSRVTLWVDGEEREAAYNTVSKVKKAYREIAVVQRRDPVLVNMCAPNTYRLQCFPVLPNGGVMKMKLGYNFKVGEKLHCPFIQERNFDIDGDFSHFLFVQGEVGFEGNKGELSTINQFHSLKQEMDFKEFSKGEVLMQLKDQDKCVWTWDESISRYVVRDLNDPPSPEKLTLVIDASMRLRDWEEAIAQLMKHERIGRVILAAYEPREISSPDQLEFAGGVDNVPALQMALKGKNDVLWLHAGQPVDFGNSRGLLQELERGFSKNGLHSICVHPGGNKLLEVIWKQNRVFSHQRAINGDDLLAKLDNLERDAGEAYRWTEVKPDKGVEVWDHLVHEAVFQEVKAAWLNKQMTTELVSMAIQHQLVTPVSGAVVLETEEQYEQTGLEPVSGEHSPQFPKAVPEPSSFLLLMMGMLSGLCYRRRVV